jgi:O-antigen ligase
MAEKIKAISAWFFPISWKFTWAFLLITLPVTSFPLLARLVGGTLVAPLSVIPLVWLFLTWLPYYFIQKKTLPGELKPLFWFAFVGIISAWMAYFIKLPEFKGHTIQKDELEALLTLGIGIAFLLVTVTRINTRVDIKKSLAWINIGGIASLSWCLLQVGIIWFLKGSYPPIVDFFQKILVNSNISDIIRGVRISGLTLEPSWLAHSLNMLYLPIWLAASRYRVSAFKFRLWKITAEDILLIFGIFTLIMTYSRIGLIGFLAVLAWFTIDIAKALSKRFSNRNEKVTTPQKSRLQRIYVTGFFLALLIASFVALLYLLSFQDNRFKKLFVNNNSNNSKYGVFNFNTPSLFSIAKKFNIGERLVYWDFGWKVFNEYPILGVGLGNVGRFSEQMISPEGWKMNEIRNILFYDTTLPNTKNLWVRLLSETGIIGFSLFLTYLIVLWLSARKLNLQTDPTMKTFSLMGQFSLLALLFEGFSLDTFALPFMWVSMGILIASLVLSRNQIILNE